MSSEYYNTRCLLYNVRLCDSGPVTLCGPVPFAVTHTRRNMQYLYRLTINRFR